MSHVHEPALGQPGGAAGHVPEPGYPDQHPASQVEFLPVFQHVDVGHIEPGPALGPEGQRQPVGQVDQALVLDRVPVHGVAEPVVDAPGVAARIVDLIGARLGRCSARGHIAVAQRAQRLALALIVRAEAFVDQCPGAHRPGPPGSAGRRSIPPVITAPCRQASRSGCRPRPVCPFSLIVHFGRRLGRSRKSSGRRAGYCLPAGERVGTSGEAHRACGGYAPVGGGPGRCIQSGTAAVGHGRAR